MKFHQVRILADENVSPQVVAFLRSQGFFCFLVSL